MIRSSRLLVGFVVLVAVAWSAAAPTGAAGPFRIGSKNFAEQIILAEIYGQGLEARGMKVERKLNMGGTLVAHQALVSGEIDMYPEYTGTALSVVLKAEPMTDPNAVYQKVKQYYERSLKATWLEPTRINNTYVLVVRPDTAEKYRLKTLSDLARVSRQLVLGAGPEFRQRKDGIPGLKAKYGMEWKEDRSIAIGLRYPALLSRQIDVIDGYATDGQISQARLVKLEDDKHLWPPYFVAPVVRMDALKEHPAVASALNQISEMLDDPQMSELNWRVDGNKEEAKDVARDFLKKKGLVK
ncbi:MAG: glycine/betaine ABC transporter substrate-binding protein [Candidatus Rokuibacteriota bacterium]|nr:MAG: glycine/betaine ABC transporter substrate-binding protein [Candidatus Rokubacteria bacterium]